MSSTELISSKTLVGGDILSTQLQALKPLFPNGAPTWYNEFSTDASSQLNAAARGDVSVADAIKTLDRPDQEPDRGLNRTGPPTASR